MMGVMATSGRGPIKTMATKKWAEMRPSRTRARRDEATTTMVGRGTQPENDRATGTAGERTTNRNWTRTVGAVIIADAGTNDPVGDTPRASGRRAATSGKIMRTTTAKTTRTRMASGKTFSDALASSEDDLVGQ